jgi:hypothetical protein
MWVAIKVVQAIKALNPAARLDLCILHNGSLPKQQTDSKEEKQKAEFSVPSGRGMRAVRERASCDFASLELKWIGASIANSIM